MRVERVQHRAHLGEQAVIVVQALASARDHGFEAFRLGDRFTADVECVGEVRGIGLANAIEIVTDRASKTPDRATAKALRNAMKRNGVLVGTTAAEVNVLKVRPPLAFTEREVPLFTEVLMTSLRELGKL